VCTAPVILASFILVVRRKGRNSYISMGRTNH
jgi:hypothetical protein